MSSESTDMGREPRHVAMSAGQSATLKPSESFRGDPTLPTHNKYKCVSFLSPKPFGDLCLRIMYLNSMDEETAFEVYYSL